MMEEFNDEVCSLLMAQKLKYVKVKQESLHCYYKSESRIDGKWVDGITLTYRSAYQGKGSWSAFTVRELGQMLPSRLTVKGIKDEDGNTLEDMVFRLRVEKCIICPDSLADPRKFEEHWSLNYVDEYGIGNDLIVNKLFPHNVHGVKEADVRATLLIQLIEAGFLKV